jgi:hypothetical protein
MYRHPWRPFFEDSQAWDYFLQLLKYEDFQSISIQITGILPKLSIPVMYISVRINYSLAATKARTHT